MNNTPHTQLSENLIVVDMDWLEIGVESVNTIVSNYEDNKLLKDSEYYKYKGMQIVFNTVKSNSFPLTPILEDAWSKGKLSQWNHYDEYNKGKMIDKLEQDKQSYLTQTITLKNK